MSMRQLKRVGIATSVLGLLTSVPPVLAPHSDAPPDVLSKTIAAERVSSLVAAYLIGVVWCLGLVWFGALLKEYLRKSEARVAVNCGWAGVAILAAMLASVGGMLTVAYHFYDRVGPDTQLLLAHGTQILTNVTAFPTVLIVIGFGLPLSKKPALGTAMLVASVLVAAVHLMSAAMFSMEGLLRPAGPFAQAAPICFSLWLGVATFSAMRNPNAAGDGIG